MHQCNGTTANAGPVMSGKPLPQPILEPQGLQLPAIGIQSARHLLDDSDK